MYEVLVISGVLFLVLIVCWLIWMIQPDNREKFANIIEYIIEDDD